MAGWPALRLIQRCSQSTANLNATAPAMHRHGGSQCLFTYYRRGPEGTVPIVQPGGGTCYRVTSSGSAGGLWVTDGFGMCQCHGDAACANLKAICLRASAGRTPWRLVCEPRTHRYCGPWSVPTWVVSARAESFTEFTSLSSAAAACGDTAQRASDAGLAGRPGG
jgi:hypothetical protein